MPRLFVAVWPPDDVIRTLAAMARPAAAGIRWTKPERVHVTLRFLGECDEAGAADVLRSARLPAARVILGPAVEQLGRGVLVVPAHGLEGLAASVIAVTRHLGQPPPERGFRGHLTVGRFKREPPPDYRQPLAASFDATEVALVRSDPPGSYVVVARFALR